MQKSLSLLGSAVLCFAVLLSGTAQAQLRPAPEGGFLPEPPAWREAQIRLQRPGGEQPASPATPAPSAGGLLSYVTPENVLEILKAAGFTKGEVTTEGNSKNAKAYVGETPVYLWFGDCKAEGCGRFEFTTYYGKQEVSQAWINSFNATKFGAKVWFTKDGGLAMSNSVYMSGGVTVDNLKRQGDLWGVFLKEILTHNPS